jgi:hypothetical protein
MDRSARTTNPEHFNANGTLKKGPKKWKRSERFRRDAVKRQELERRLAAERKRSHGQLANRILAQGKTVKTEKISYKAFQKRFGRSVKVRAPGMLVRILERKAKAAGGELIEVTTWNTRLSQFDHTTGQYTKKALSQREHVFGDGVTEPVQRDLYSAFLVFCCLANILDIRQVQKAWPSAEPLLRQAMSRSSQSASGKAPCFPQGLNTLRADRLSEKVIPQCEVADAVAKARAAKSSGMKLLEPPGFSHGEVQVETRTRIFSRSQLPQVSAPLNNSSKAGIRSSKVRAESLAPLRSLRKRSAMRSATPGQQSSASACDGIQQILCSKSEITALESPRTDQVAKDWDAKAATGRPLSPGHTGVNSFE